LKGDFGMKKTIVMTLAFFVLASGAAFAVGEDLDPATGYSKAATGAVIKAEGAATVVGFYKFSKGVYAGAKYDPFSYALTTAHTSGSKYYGTGFDATAIYVKDAAGVVKDSLAIPDDSVAELAFTTGWTKL
jgi:hypothetical protein